MSSATVSADSKRVTVAGKVNLTTAQIAGIAIASVALLILLIGIVACIFFVRKRKRRLELEDHRGLTYSTPKSPDMQDIYFPPPPFQAPRNRRASAFSIISRRRSRTPDERLVDPGMLAGTSLQGARQWPRYYPIMPEENIGIASTTNYAHQVIPRATTAYIPAPAPSPRVQIPSRSNSAISSSSPAGLPYYRPSSSSSSIYPPPPPAARLSMARNKAQTGQRHNRMTISTRQSQAYSFMTDISEGQQISTREALPSAGQPSVSDRGHAISANRSSTVVSKSFHSRSESTKRARRPTLMIDIPIKMSSRLPPPPPPPKSRTENAAHPKPLPSGAVNASQTRPPLLRESQFPSTASRSMTYSSSRDSTISAALPSSQAMADDPMQFLAAQDDRHGSSRSSVAIRKQSRTGSRCESDTSVTEFEDSEDDSDATPPKEEEKRLTPVQESSPMSTLRYPKIPRASNQVVSRNPGSPKQRDSSADPLAMEQITPKKSPGLLRPDISASNAASTALSLTIAQGIGNRLWKTELSPQGKLPLDTPEWTTQRTTESWVGWARTPATSIAISDNTTPTANIGISPVASATSPSTSVGGLPRITPSRRGDELFLEMRL